jgi:hypothetical protein
VHMHAKDLVGINSITRVLLAYTCQQGEYPRGHVLPLRLPVIKTLKINSRQIWTGYNVSIRVFSEIRDITVEAYFV